MVADNVMCPRCGSADLIQGNVSYDGCVTDNDRYGESQAWSHDSFQCKVCKTVFTVWDEDDEFAPIPPKDEKKISFWKRW